MAEEALFGQLLVFGARTAVIAVRIDADAAARGKDTRHFDIFRVHQLDKVFHDDVDTVFMEGSVAAEAEEV